MVPRLGVVVALERGGGHRADVVRLGLLGDVHRQRRRELAELPAPLVRQVRRHHDDRRAHLRDRGDARDGGHRLAQAHVVGAQDTAHRTQQAHDIDLVLARRPSKVDLDVVARAAAQHARHHALTMLQLGEADLEHSGRRGIEIQREAREQHLERARVLRRQGEPNHVAARLLGAAEHAARDHAHVGAQAQLDAVPVCDHRTGRVDAHSAPAVGRTTRTGLPLMSDTSAAECTARLLTSTTPTTSSCDR